MAYYDSSAYDFETFSPKRELKPQGGFEPRIVRAPKKSFKQQKQERKKHLQVMARVMCVSLVLFLLLGCRIYLQVSLTEKTKLLDEYNAKIKIQQSESVALNNELYEMMSLDVVEQKAMNELHMVKRDASQVRYIAVGNADNTADGARVVETDTAE